MGARLDEITLTLDDSRPTGPHAMLLSADSYLEADARAAAGSAARRVDQVGVYLTDEVFLYRICDVLVTGAGEMVEIEDCDWLDVVRVPARDLAKRRLRVVTPG